ncbi:MAG: hypothetical protein ABL886_13670, partial [Rhodoglobus sp.]
QVAHKAPVLGVAECHRGRRTGGSAGARSDVRSSAHREPLRAGDVYGPLLAEQLVVEMGHRASIEQRGLGVTTTSGIISLLVALSALLLGRGLR